MLFSYFRELISEYNLDRCNTKIFSTGIFRDIPDKRAFIWDFYVRTQLFFNIISHDLEAFYLEKAWIGKYTGEAPIAIINIGGETTELVIYKDGSVMDTFKLSVGVGSVLSEYPSINEEYSGISLSSVVNYITELLPNIGGSGDSVHTAIYTGGEQRYMRLATYKMKENETFTDVNHPFSISLDNYSLRNDQIFSQVKLTELQGLMPENPKWMNGARACSAIAQAICMRYGIETIIPSDSNLIDGVIIQEARKAVICGSFNKHLKEISSLIKQLQLNHVTVLSPKSTSVVGSKNGFVLFKHDNLINSCTWSVESLHIQAIEEADLVIICNFDNYIGSATSMEIGYALGCTKRIVFIDDNPVARGCDIPSEICRIQTGILV